jgi:symplekin
MSFSRGEALDDSLAALQQQDENLSDDDNAQPDLDGEEAIAVDQEDPLLLAIDDLEGRVVSALDEVKLHPGVRTSAETNVHEELGTLLRPVLEVAAHTGPSIARTYYRGVGSDGVDSAADDVYERTVSDLVLPVLLEMAQSDMIPAKRASSLEFFRHLWQEWHKAGSWLDSTTSGSGTGPHGAGGSSGGGTTVPRHLLKRRKDKRLAREGELLRYWVQASIACTLPGVFTSENAESATASRGIIAASASLRPSLKHIVQRIKDADDRGANRLYAPVMKMVEGVLKKLFLSQQGEAVLSACIKFLEIVILCCSRKPQEAAARRRGQNIMEDFSLDDLPEGHPIITREALESIAEYAFTTLRGLTLLGGQVKIDVNVLSDMMLGVGNDGVPSTQVVSILKPAALAYLDVESSFVSKDGNDSLNVGVDRSSLDFDFMLAQKSYALTINAISALAMNRPIFFEDAATCLARRAAHPPELSKGGALSDSAAKAVTSQLRASCLTLLRNSLSVTTSSFRILHKALSGFDMEQQADKALGMARHANSLKTAGRAARNRANIYYEWESSGNEQRATKRQRETDNALAKMRAAKAARGLGHGIQLPSNMSDAVELILSNLSHLPEKRPSASSKTRKVAVTLNFIVDAVMTNGASLSQEEGRWYDRDGGASWAFDKEADDHFRLSSKFLADFDESTIQSETLDNARTKRRKLMQEQCGSAASDAVHRMISTSKNYRSKHLADFGNKIAAKLLFTLSRMKAVSETEPLSTSEVVTRLYRKVGDSKVDAITKKFIEAYPLAVSYLGVDSYQMKQISTTLDFSINERILNEALVHCCADSELYNHSDTPGLWKYDSSLDIFVASAVYACEQADEKPGDKVRQKIAAQSASILQRDVEKLPRLTVRSLRLVCAICDVESITKKAAEAARKFGQEAISASAAVHAAKVAAEKRATSALLILRDAAFQRDSVDIRKGAVDCAVGIATGRVPSNNIIQDKALKLVMNVLFPKSESLSSAVVGSATEELHFAFRFAVEKYDEIQLANGIIESKGDYSMKNPLAAQSDKEKEVFDKLRKPVVLYMALCVRNPKMIETLFKTCSGGRADALSKVVRANMPKLSRAVAAKHGTASTAIGVASETKANEVPMLLSFLENLTSSPDEELIQACYQIQDLKLTVDGKKDPRFIIPVVSAMKRKDIVARLPEFVLAEDKIFLAALVHSSDRVGRHALIFRDEPDTENPTLRGMTLCEQLVFLHKLDFAAASIPQKRYLAAIKLCLEDDGVYNDRVVMAALDYLSGMFLAGTEKLPLAFMRTCILVCTKHESLHSWIAHLLLPRLVDGRIFDDPRQWEGWMRCAHVLQQTGESGVSTDEAIGKLPPEQLLMYQTKWAGR